MLSNIYEIFSNTLRTEPLKKITEIPASPRQRNLGRIDENILGAFARTPCRNGEGFDASFNIVNLSSLDCL